MQSWIAYTLVKYAKQIEQVDKDTIKELNRQAPLNDPQKEFETAAQ